MPLRRYLDPYRIEPSEVDSLYVPPFTYGRAAPRVAELARPLSLRDALGRGLGRGPADEAGR